MKTFRPWSLVGVLLVALSAAGAAASPSLSPAAAPFGCTNAIRLNIGAKNCLWVTSARRFAYCGYYVTPDRSDRLLCVSAVSGYWVRMAIDQWVSGTSEDRHTHSSYGRDLSLVGFRRPADVMRFDWYSDRPADAAASCRGNVRFFYCQLSQRLAVWFKPDGSFALLRATKSGWNLQARG